MSTSDRQGDPPIDIGIFAHNEAAGIEAMLRGLADQDMLTSGTSKARVLVLANGCTDDTVRIARTTVADLGLAARIEVHDMAEGGKSRTWNRFVHDLSRVEVELLVFMDADIVIPDPTAIRRLCALVHARPALRGAPSRAVKDIVHARPTHLSVLERLIVMGSSAGVAWRTAVCGQLYVLRAPVARGFHLPIGLPVEDGFVRAMVVTDRLATPTDISVLDGEDDIFHVYASERILSALIRHQIRLVIGSAVNAVLFARLAPHKGPDLAEVLREAAADPGWLAAVLAESLPSWRYGYVPWAFLTLRLTAWRQAGPERWRVRKIFSTLLGFSFDALVYVLAQIKMARGTGAGHW